MSEPLLAHHRGRPRAQNEVPTAAPATRGDHRQPPRRPQHAGLEGADAVADEAVGERGQAERRVHEEVDGDAGGEAGERAPLGPGGEPGGDRHEDEHVAVRTEEVEPRRRTPPGATSALSSTRPALSPVMTARSLGRPPTGGPGRRRGCRGRRAARRSSTRLQLVGRGDRWSPTRADGDVRREDAAAATPLVVTGSPSSISSITCTGDAGVDHERFAVAGAVAEPTSPVRGEAHADVEGGIGEELHGAAARR